MHHPWRLLCDTLWPEPNPLETTLPRPQPGRYKNTHFVLPYKNPVVKNTIRNNKFHFHTQSAKELAAVVDTFLRNYPQAIVIPIPSSPNREQKRGFKHLLNILQHSQYRDQVRTNILFKSANTPQQSHVPKAIRLAQQHGSFTCDIPNIHSLARTIILFDDVVTTESTIAAARQTIAPHLPSETKIICFAIAH